VGSLGMEELVDAVEEKKAKVMNYVEGTDFDKRLKKLKYVTDKWNDT